MNENIMIVKFVPAEKNLAADKKQPTKMSGQTDKPTKGFDDFFKKANLEIVESSKSEKTEVDLLSAMVVPIAPAVWVDVSDKNVQASLADEAMISVSLDGADMMEAALIGKETENKGDSLFVQELLNLAAKPGIDQKVSDIASKAIANQAVSDIASKAIANQAVSDIASKAIANQAVSDIASKAIANQAVSDIASKAIANQAVSDIASKAIVNQAVSDIMAKPVISEKLSDISNKTMMNQEFANANSKIDDPNSKKIMDGLNKIFVTEAASKVGQVQLLDLLKGKSGVNISKLTEMSTEQNPVLQSDANVMIKADSVNDLDFVSKLPQMKDADIENIGEILKSNPQQTLVVKEISKTVQRPDEHMPVNKNQSVGESFLTEIKEAEISVMKAADNGFLKDQSQSQTQGGTDNSFFAKEIVVPRQELTTTPIPSFAVPLTEVSRNVQVAPQTPETPASLEKYNIPEQIVEQARLIKSNESTQMVIKLKPEHLGELTLKVSVENGVVSASFHSDNVNVRAALETSLIQLKQEFAAQGIKVDNVGVYGGLSQFLSDGQNQANREQHNTRFKNRKVDLADFEEESEKVSTTIMDGNKVVGVDYLI